MSEKTTELLREFNRIDKEFDDLYHEVCLLYTSAALISQKPPLHRRVKISLLYDGFFLLPSCGSLRFNMNFGIVPT